MARMYSRTLENEVTTQEGKPNEVGAHHARSRRRVPDAPNALGTTKGIRIVDTYRREVSGNFHIALIPKICCMICRQLSLMHKFLFWKARRLVTLLSEENG